MIGANPGVPYVAWLHAEIPTERHFLPDGSVASIAIMAEAESERTGRRTARFVYGPPRPTCLRLAVGIWAILGSALIVVVVGGIALDSTSDRASTPQSTNSGALLAFGIAIVIGAFILRQGRNGGRIFLVVVAGLLAWTALNVAGSTSANQGGAAGWLPAVLGVLAALAIAGTVLMFLPAANSFTREIGRLRKGR